MIGKVISSLLKANAALLTLVNTNSIYPYVLNENTALPAIVYTVDSITPDYDKDGWTGDDITFSVISLSDNFANLQSIAAQVRAALELKSGTTESITYWNILLTGQLEGYSISEDSFLNRLTFTTTIISYS